MLQRQGQVLGRSGRRLHFAYQAGVDPEVSLESDLAAVPSPVDQAAASDLASVLKMREPDFLNPDLVFLDSY